MTEVYKLKIALTSSCTLRCNHCNIDKDSGLDIDFNKAKAGVDLLFSSPGYFKRLELYGGEPFLRFSLLKKIASYARRKSIENDKKFSLSIATNATLLNKNIISWIKENKVNISISFSGTEESHNYNRRYANGKGSYEVVYRNIKNLLKEVSPDYLVCLYCVDGGFAKNMRKDFKEIIDIGFRIINIECVSGRGWCVKDYKEFEKGLSFIFENIIKSIENGNFIYLESFTEMLRDKRTWTFNCPMYRDLEMYPDGNYGFYPYAFIKYSSVYKKISVGNWKNGINFRYSNCFPGCNSCNSCCSDYYILQGLSDGSYAYQIRTHMIKQFFLELLRRKKEEKIKNYLLKLQKIINITYI
ncbi:MAG: radical SAM protein [Elusimicrobiales bacterium]